MRHAPLTMMTLALTGVCNLRCEYCYQNAPSGLRMPWPLARSAADRLVQSPCRRVDLVFAGREPLLALELIERVVPYVEQHRRRGQTVRYSVATNGTLLRSATIAFLERQQFEVLLSFDGVPAAQSIRGERSFTRIDAAIDRLRDEAPALFWRRLTACITLDADAVPYLSESFSYLLGKHLQAIVISPAHGQSSRWTPPVINALGRELRRIHAAARRHYEATGQVPFVSFRKTADEVRGGREVVCGAATGASVTVDTDGEAYACPMFAESSQRFVNQRFAAAIRPMRMGHVAGPGFWRNLAGLPVRARATGLFHLEDGRHSLHGQCSRCRYRADCKACPVAPLMERGHEDPHKVPDYICAFNWVLADLRRRFPAQPEMAALLDGRPPKPRMVRALLQRVAMIEGKRRPVRGPLETAGAGR